MFFLDRIFFSSLNAVSFVVQCEEISGYGGKYSMGQHLGKNGLWNADILHWKKAAFLYGHIKKSLSCHHFLFFMRPVLNFLLKTQHFGPHA